MPPKKLDLSDIPRTVRTAQKHTKMLAKAVASIRNSLDNDPVGIKVLQDYGVNRKGEISATLKAEAKVYDKTVVEISTNPKRNGRDGRGRPC